MPARAPWLLQWLCHGLVLLGLALGMAGAARGAVVLDDGLGTVDAWPEVRLLLEQGENPGLAAVLQRRDDFHVPQTARANLGVLKHPAWLRMPLEVAPGSDGRWVLEIDYPSLDRIDAWLLEDGRVVAQAVLGDSVPAAQRLSDTVAHAWPLALKAGARHELLLRVDTLSTAVVPVHFHKPAAFQREEANRQLLQGLLLGVGLSLLMYSVANWVSTRERVFVYYGMTIAFSSAYFFAFHGMGAQHLWGWSNWMTDHAAPLFALLAAGSALLLAERLLDVRGLSPRTADVVQGLAAIAGIVALLLVLRVVSFRFAHVVATMLVLTPMVVAVPAAVLRWRQGDPAAVYVCAGWAVYGLGAAPMAMLLRGWADYNLVTQYSSQAGSLFEVLMWLHVLGLRSAQMRWRAEQAERDRQLLQTQVHTDALTGLYNRRGLLERLQSIVATAAPGRGVAVFVGDLDGFKPVNDRHGHEAGDELLAAVARRLRKAVRHGDIVARPGGDEFVVVSADLASPAMAQQIGQHLVEAFREPFVVRGTSVKVGLTLGYALSPDDGSDAAELMRRADGAMYVGKRRGKSRLQRAEMAGA